MSFSRTPSLPSQPRGSKDAPRFRSGTALSAQDQKSSNFQKRKNFDKQRRTSVKEKEADFVPMDIEFAYSALDKEELRESEKVFIGILNDDPENKEAREILGQIRKAMKGSPRDQSSTSFASNVSLNYEDRIDMRPDSPQFVQLVSSISGLFAPPDGAEDDEGNASRSLNARSKCTCDGIRELEVLCATCRVLVCFKCGFNYHRGHEVITVEQVAAKERKDFDDRLKILSNLAEDMYEQKKSCDEKLSNLKRDRNSVASSIKTRIDKIVEVVQRRGEELQREWTMISNKRIENLSTASELLKAKSDYISTQIGSISSRIKSGQDIELLLEKLNISDEIDRLNSEELVYEDTIFQRDLQVLDGSYEDIMNDIPHCVTIVDENTPDVNKCSVRRIESQDKTTVIFRVTLENFDGDRLMNSSDKLDFKVLKINDIHSGDENEEVSMAIETEIEDEGDGSYSLSFDRENFTTDYRCDVKIHGKHIESSPFYIRQQNMKVNSQPSMSSLASSAALSSSKNAPVKYMPNGRMSQKSLQSKISSGLLKIVQKINLEEEEQERKSSIPRGIILFGENAGRILAVSSEFQPSNAMYQAENLMKYNKHSAWVAKTAGNEFVEIALSHGNNENYMCHVERIQLYNLNTIKYKLSFQRVGGKMSRAESANKILGRKGSASILKTQWEAFAATPELTKCPGDLTEWTIELNEEEKLIDIASIRLDVVGNVNMATFYALRVWGSELSKAIPRTLPNAESLISTSGISKDGSSGYGVPVDTGSLSATTPLLCLPIDSSGDDPINLVEENTVGQMAVDKNETIEVISAINVKEVHEDNDDNNDNESYDDDFD